MRRQRAILAVAVVAAFVTVGQALALDEGELRDAIREAGLVPYWSFKPAEVFSYPDVASGRQLSLDSLKSQVVLVNVWATWCPPCVKEMPSLQALHEEFRDRGLVVIGINVRDKRNPAAVVQWLSERNLVFQNLKATDGGPNFPSRYTIPQTFLIDRSGRLLANKSGPLDWASAPVKALIARLVDRR